MRGMHGTPGRSAAAAAAIAIAGLGMTATPAVAAQPVVYGPFDVSYSDVIDCGDFQASVVGSLTAREIDYLDASGSVTGWTQFVRAPRDVWTNLTTGRTIVVRGEFQQIYTPDADTGKVRVAVSGFRYLVNEAGSGVTVQEVGRIVYDDLDEVTVVSAAGHHELSDGALVEPGLCDELRS